MTPEAIASAIDKQLVKEISYLIFPSRNGSSLRPLENALGPNFPCMSFE